MADTRRKTSYVTEIQLRAFLRHYLPNVWFLTFTLPGGGESLSKVEVMKMWKPVCDWLNRHGVIWVEVWQLQKRGAWHVHILVNQYCDVNQLRPFCVARGWGSQSPQADRVGAGSYRWQNPERLVKYLCRYLTRAMCEHVPARVRLTGGKAVTRCGTTKFHWNTSLSRLWREGQAAFLREWNRAVSRSGRLWHDSCGYYSEFEWVREWVEERLLAFFPISDGVNPYSLTPTACPSG